MTTPSNNIIDKIIEDQTINKDNSNNVIIPIPKHDELEKVLNSLASIKDTNKVLTLEENDNTLETEDNDKEESVKSNTYDNILKEIQDNESSMELAIKDADELSKAVKESLIYFLNIRKPNRNGILMHGVSDALNASAKLLDISVNGRYKLASMKKLRASIIKDRDSKNNNNNTEFSLLEILD